MAKNLSVGNHVQSSNSRGMAMIVCITVGSNGKKRSVTRHCRHLGGRKYEYGKVFNGQYKPIGVLEAN